MTIQENLVSLCLGGYLQILPAALEYARNSCHNHRMYDDDPTLGDLLRSFWAARLFVFAGALLGLLAAGIYIFVITPVYKAEMIVAPADGYALGDYASSLSPDRSLTLPFWRPSEPDNVSTDFYRFVHTVRGASVASILLKDKAVLGGIRKDSGWLEGADSWSAEELAAYLQKRVDVTRLGATPLRALSYEHPDPEFAASLLRKIHLVSDQLIRRDRRRQSQARIDYLQESLAKTAHPDHRRGITNLLMQQEHIQMLANLDEAYAAIIVEPPSAGPRPSWPKKSYLFSGMILLGAFLGYALWSVLQRK